MLLASSGHRLGFFGARRVESVCYSACAARPPLIINVQRASSAKSPRGFLCSSFSCCWRSKQSLRVKSMHHARGILWMQAREVESFSESVAKLNACLSNGCEVVLRLYEAFHVTGRAHSYDHSCCSGNCTLPVRLGWQRGQCQIASTVTASGR